MRTLLDLMHENQAAVQDWRSDAQEVLLHALTHLKILDSELGDEELRMCVGAELMDLAGE